MPFSEFRQEGELLVKTFHLSVSFAVGIVLFLGSGSMRALAQSSGPNVAVTVTEPDLFVSDFGTGSIYDFAPNSSRTTFASGIRGPSGLAFDGSGNLFVATITDVSILKITPSGVQSVFNSFATPENIIFDASRTNLYEAQQGGNYIWKFIPALGSNRVIYAAVGVSNPVEGLAFDPSGNLFVSSPGGTTNLIYKITPDGTVSTFASGLNFPYGLATDSNGDLFEADQGSGKIYEFSPDGVRSTFATGLNKPFGLTFDPSGNLFEADLGSGKIYEFSPSGSRTTFATGLGQPTFLTFAVPEPSGFVLALFGFCGLLIACCYGRQKTVSEGR